ncbi:cyclin-dependent kinase inhibitor 1C-like isoform X2 [Cololabis saira]|uniref:cyclin-dependent kinase inhibitor 1C-like isoform X2 n=1 Tax=Cololabis saira TaxID=129043 RepID=UPI002AD4537E|nr:cyclin-dependent kinase inhibitor 1C-like isoform X2 [Cololabis saira]
MHHHHEDAERTFSLQAELILGAAVEAAVALGRGEEEEEARFSSVLAVISREAARQICSVFRQLYTVLVLENQVLKDQVLENQLTRLENPVKTRTRTLKVQVTRLENQSKPRTRAALKTQRVQNSDGSAPSAPGSAGSAPGSAGSAPGSAGSAPGSAGSAPGSEVTASQPITEQDPQREPEPDPDLQTSSEPEADVKQFSLNVTSLPVSSDQPISELPGEDAASPGEDQAAAGDVAMETEEEDCGSQIIADSQTGLSSEQQEQQKEQEKRFF